MNEEKRKQAIDNDTNSWLFCVVIHKVHAAIEYAEDAAKPLILKMFFHDFYSHYFEQ